MTDIISRKNSSRFLFLSLLPVEPEAQPSPSSPRSDASSAFTVALKVMNYRSCRLWKTVWKDSLTDTPEQLFKSLLNTDFNLNFSLRIWFYESTTRSQLMWAYSMCTVLLHSMEVHSLRGDMRACAGIHAADRSSRTPCCQNVSIDNFNFVLQWWACSVTQLIYQVLPVCFYPSK